jgi:hypothetical protein
MGSVIELTPRRLAKKPQSWSVEIEHTEDAVSFTLHDVQDDERSYHSAAHYLKWVIDCLYEKYPVENAPAPQQQGPETNCDWENSLPG